MRLPHLSRTLRPQYPAAGFCLTHKAEFHVVKALKQILIASPSPDNRYAKRRKELMKKILFWMMVISAVVCFFDLTPSSAADKPKIVFGEERHGIDNDTGPRDVRRVLGGVDGLNYSRENYTALAPSSGESYPQTATSVFYLDETIYLVDRYRIATPGTYTRYYIITDVVGTTVAADASTFIISTTGYHWGTNTISFLDIGSYVYQSITIGPGEWILSHRFSFIVEY